MFIRINLANWQDEMKIDFKIDIKTKNSVGTLMDGSIDETPLDLACLCGHNFKERLGTIRALKSIPCPACGKAIQIQFSQNIVVETKTNERKGWLKRLFGG